MNNKNKHTTPLPLDTLVQRLSIAGFAVSPRQRLQLWQVLQQFGIQHLQHPLQLKYRMAPIIATDAKEQQEFYDIFDRLWEESQQYTAPEPVLEAPAWWQRISRTTWAFILLGILLFAGAGWWYWQYQKAAALPRLLSVEHERQITIGQPFLARNQSSKYDSSTTRFRWELRDARTGQLERFSNRADRWKFTLKTNIGSPDKELRLLAREGEQQDTFSVQLRVVCANPPDATFKSPIDLRQQEPFTLRPDAPKRPGHRYRWNFGDGSSSKNGYEVQHQFEGVGGYTIRLDITDTIAAGYCENSFSQDISVGNPRAFLAFKPLQYDERVPLVLHFRDRVWLILGLILLLAVWFWYRWLRQPPPQPEGEDQKEKILQSRFAHADQPPYEIPFQAHDELLLPGPELYQLAQILRLRQQGLREELDVPSTIQQTIKSGGFPAVQFRRTTLPPNYLFLIDEQAPHSHQAQLYRYLLDFMKGQDVHISAFWYNNTPKRFWNAAYPKGLSLEQLQRLFPHYRLLIMGDAHGLLDAWATEQHQALPELTNIFRRWKSRLLLTPLPANDWTYRESALYDLLAVFPSDSVGIQAAMAYLEEEHEEEDERAMPAFADWQLAHRQPPEPPETNYRRWNRLETFDAYFSGRSELYRWFKAMMVHPQPNWSLSLVIGKAIGAPVTFDNMLLLSRLPVLQGQPMPPRLRLKLLATLDLETERKARAALAEELEAVAPAVEGSHANSKLQVQLAMQHFLLDTQDKEHRDVLLYMLDGQALNKRQRIELEEALERQSGSAIHLESYLKGRKGDAVKPPTVRRQLNEDFYRALAATTLLAILGLMVGLFEGQVDLRGVKSSVYNPIWEQRPQPDSAIIYQNRAVVAWDSLRQQYQTVISADLEGIVADFKQAVELRGGDYSLAAANALKTFYHQGLLSYHRYLQEQDSTLLTTALPFFRQAGALTDAQHALGLIALYHNSRNAAEQTFYELQAAGFFDTLQLRPNLRTMLFMDEDGAVLSNCVAIPDAQILSERPFCLGDTVRLQVAPSADPVDYYLVRWGDGQEDTLQQAGTVTHAYHIGGGDLSIQLLAFTECEEEGRAYQIRGFLLTLQAPPRILNIFPGELAACAPYEFSPEAEVQGTVDYYWDFGNGLQSTESIPTVIYNEPGLYSLRLRVSNACGADEVVMEKAIEIRPSEDCEDFVPLIGVVTDDETGAPIDGAEVKVESFTLRTDRQGQFSTPDFDPDRELSIILIAKGYRDTTLRRRMNGELLRLRMEKKDTDGDGIADLNDRCPEEAGVEAKQGCP